MPPPASTPTHISDPISKNMSYQTPSRTRNGPVTPPNMPATRVKKAQTVEPKADEKLVPAIKSDLTNIRALVTCSICDQLLYEPFTIQCGHTYCYSCLCSWFIPNRRKKTCPECRTIIKQMPAPAFMIKQTVDIFVNRAELMPADESVEQHKAKRAEEVLAVERDRNGPDGLFKGLFPAGRQEPVLDEADGVHRCPNCHSEYLGGPSCLSCGQEIDGEDYYDFFSGDDLDDLDAFDHELQAELENEFRRLPGGNQLLAAADAHHVHFGGHYHHHHHYHHGHHDQSSLSPTSDDSQDDDNSSESDSEDDDSSLQDFIVNDESPESQREDTPRGYASAHVEHAAVSPIRAHTVDISDDDSEEEGPVVNRARRGRRPRQISSPQRGTFTRDDDSSASEAGDTESIAERLRGDGWSPLHESEPEDSSVRESTDISDRSDDEGSDTETIGNGEEDRSPNVGAGRRAYGWHGASDLDDDTSEDGMSSVLDRDGDTEMSASPDARESGRNGSNYQYDEYPDSESSRGGTDEYEEPFDRERYKMEADGYVLGENGYELGEGHALRDVNDDPSDASSEAPRQRRRRALNRDQLLEQSYDPRISQILAHHQDNMREGSLRNPIHLDDFGSAIRDSDDFEGLDFNHDHSVVRQPANSRARRVALYRRQSPINQIPRRRTQSPSVTRIISSSSRPARVARQYVDRSGNVGQ